MDTKVKATSASISSGIGRRRRRQQNSLPLSATGAYRRPTCSKKATSLCALSHYFAMIYIVIALSAIAANQNYIAYAFREQLSLNNPRAPYNGPHVEILPNDPIFLVKAQTSADKTLVCRSSGDHPGAFDNLRWAGPDRTDNSDELRQKHTVIQEAPGSLELEFKSPTVDDSGIYYCLGTYHSTEFRNASIQVKVVSPIKLENCPDRQFITKGHNKPAVTCQVSADQPKVTIWKDSKPIDQYEGRYSWDNNDGLIINGETQESDAGKYTIKVRSDITGDKITQNIDVEVHTAPVLVRYGDRGIQFSGVDGKEAILNCTATGNPKPLFNWLSPQGKNLTQEGGYIINPERGTLQINKVNVNLDKGDFKCVAYNDVGSDSMIVPMTVYTPPKILSFNNETVEEGGQVTFTCRARGFPKPTFSIRRRGLNQLPYRPGDGVTSEEDTALESDTSDIWVYRLKMLASRALFGLHYCNATNSADSAEAPAQLFVTYKPDLSQTPSEQFNKIGKDIVITCHIKAYPAPVVTWFLDQAQLVNPTTNITTSADGQTHIITMSPPTPQQTLLSKFKCRASNKHGINEQEIVSRFTQSPGPVVATSVTTTPTTAVLRLSVPNDGGDRVKYFKYTLEGKYIMHLLEDQPISGNFPYRNYPEHRLGETVLDASPIDANYTIRNLYPLYKYRLNIRAVNSVGPGDRIDISFDTQRPMAPEPPVILKSGALASHSEIYSEYNNGYLLRWSPPELDNGEPVLNYVIRFNKIVTNALDIKSDEGQERVVEQMNDRPLHASIGPLEIDQRYRIQIQARNRIGTSREDSIIIRTAADRRTMPEFEAQTLAWLTEQSTPTLIAMLLLATILLIIIDLTFCVCFQIGLAHTLRKTCCPVKSGSVVSDKNYT